jgi:adenylylsulfate kinase-like enzyme
MPAAETPVLWIAGPSGVGKTTVAWRIYTELCESGVDAAYVDIDQLGICYPETGSDPGRYSMKARNADAVVSNFADAGAHCVVISGVVDPVHGVRPDEFRHAVTRCWLSVDPDVLRERFTARGTRLEDIETVLREADETDEARIADVVIDTTGISVDDVAQIVRERTEWPDLTAGSGRAANVARERAGAERTDGSALVLCGAPGVGKSRVGFEVFLRTVRTGAMTAYVDVDQLGFFGGGQADHALRARNLASVWSTYRLAGAHLLVAAVNITDEPSTQLYEAALADVTFRWCRLHVGVERLTERIFERGEGRGSWPEPGDRLLGRPPDELRELAREAARSAGAIAQWTIGVRVDTDELTVDQATDAVVDATGWT